MKDQSIRELERLFRHTGSHHDQADWIAARIKNRELEEAKVRLASQLGHLASRIVFPHFPLATHSVPAWFEACCKIPTASERSGYAFAVSLIQPETEQEQDWLSVLDSEQRTTLSVLAKFVRTLNQDIAPIGKLVVLNCAEEAGRELRGRSPTHVEMVMQRLVYALSPDTQDTILDLVLTPPAQEAALGESGPQTAIAVMQRALFPWLLYSYDPLDTIVKRLEVSSS